MIVPRATRVLHSVAEVVAAIPLSAISLGTSPQGANPLSTSPLSTSPLSTSPQSGFQPARRVIVGLVGAPGSGKSTIGADLVARLGPHAALLGMDGFHLPQARLVELGRRERMGAFDTFDVDGFVTLLRDIRFAEGPFRAPGFDRTAEEAVVDGITISAGAQIVVVEGNYLLHDSGGWAPVAELLDVSFFVTVDRDIRLSRLIERHVRFGKTVDAAAAWAGGPDETNARLIETTAPRADYQIKLD